LPLTCSGHIGYAIVPWRRREGLASFALAALLPEARAQGLPHVDLTVDPDNAASIGVIRNCGGALVTRRAKHSSVGAGDEALYRISLTAPGA
jgi:predicted acetyltransferase